MDLLQFGSRIKSVRREKHLTLEKLAEQINISRNFLWEIEAGRKAPAIGTLYDLALSLDVSVDYLMGLSLEPRNIGKPDLSAHRKAVSDIIMKIDTMNDKELRFVETVIDSYRNCVRK